MTKLNELNNWHILEHVSLKFPSGQPSSRKQALSSSSSPKGHVFILVYPVPSLVSLGSSWDLAVVTAFSHPHWPGQGSPTTSPEILTSNLKVKEGNTAMQRQKWADRDGWMGVKLRKSFSPGWFLNCSGHWTTVFRCLPEVVQGWLQSCWLGGLLALESPPRLWAPASACPGFGCCRWPGVLPGPFHRSPTLLPASMSPTNSLTAWWGWQEPLCFSPPQCSILVLNIIY